MATDEPFVAAMAVGTQTAFGTPLTSVRDLSGTINETHGLVLGYAEAGDGETGIALPSITSRRTDKGFVTASFSKRADALEQVLAEGLAITWIDQGNGVARSSSAGQAKPHAGLHALHHMAGLFGQNQGTSATLGQYKYTPRHNISTGGPTVYGTIKLWVGDWSYVFTDCLVESLIAEVTPGALSIVTANIKVGTYSPEVGTSWSDGVTLPTITYGTQSTLSPPKVSGVNFDWYSARDFTSMTCSINNDVVEVERSNSATGTAFVQQGRSITMNATVLIDASDETDQEHDNLQVGAVPTENASFDLGTVSTGVVPYNAVNYTFYNPQVTSINADRSGTALVVDIEAQGTSTTVGNEFKKAFV